MDHIVVAFEAVAPMFLIIAFGGMVKYRFPLPREEWSRINSLVFHWFLPCMLFINMYRTDLTQSIHFELIGFAVAVLFGIWVLSMVLVPRFEQQPAACGVIVQAIFRSNFVSLGIPMAQHLLGEGEIGLTVMTVAVVVPLQNILGVITLEVFRGGRANVRSILHNIVTNPMVVGCATGLLVRAVGLKLPYVVERAVSDIGGAATPMLLFILGTYFNLEYIQKGMKSTIICTVLRLVIVPGVVLSAAAAMGFRGAEFVTLLAIFSAPMAMNAFTMAEQMGGDAGLASNVVVTSSLFSCVTMCFWIALAKTLGLF